MYKWVWGSRPLFRIRGNWVPFPALEHKDHLHPSKKTQEHLSSNSCSQNHQKKWAREQVTQKKKKNKQKTHHWKCQETSHWERAAEGWLAARWRNFQSQKEQEHGYCQTNKLMNKTKEIMRNFWSLNLRAPSCFFGLALHELHELPMVTIKSDTWWLWQGIQQVASVNSFLGSSIYSLWRKAFIDLNHEFTRHASLLYTASLVLVHTHVHVCACMRTYIHTHMQAHIQACTRSHTHRHTHLCMRARICSGLSGFKSHRLGMPQSGEKTINLGA